VALVVFVEYACSSNPFLSGLVVPTASCDDVLVANIFDSNHSSCDDDCC